MAQKTYYQKNKKKLLKQVSEYKKKNRDKYRFYTLRSRTVKITFEQYKAIYSNNPKCYICSRKQTSKKLCIDHDHKTGKVRGLLCNKCNRALGLFQDSSKLLKKAVRYLENKKGPLAMSRGERQSQRAIKPPNP